MCVTGPVELCYNQFGTNIYPDVLLNFARSINRIIKNSIHAGEMEIPAISIDEPSLGVVSLSLKEEEIKEALEIASSHIQKDVQIHLHSPLHYKLILPIKSINVIGVESASNPSYLNLIEKEKLEEYEKFLRVGISRTDIIKMAGEYERKYKVDPWKERKILDVVNEFESPLTISRRLEKAIEIFGGRIRYAGPDCGLGGWPSQDTAFQLLKNTSEGIKIFRESSKE
jgi:5-methyltetrahydropteroyltriglutamate--homocysteine methyltransferase